MSGLDLYASVDATGADMLVASLRARDERDAFIERFDNATLEEICELLKQQYAVEEQRRSWKRRIRIGGM